MPNYPRFRLLTAAALFCVSAMPAQASPTDSPLAGTAWTGTDLWGAPLTVHFAARPGMAYEVAGAIWTNGTWRDTAEGVYFEMNNKAAEYRGQRTGSTMQGTGSARAGQKGPWALRQLATVPVEFSRITAGAGMAASQRPGSTGSLPGLLSANVLTGNFSAKLTSPEGAMEFSLTCSPTGSCEMGMGPAPAIRPAPRATSPASALSAVEDLAGVVRAFDFARTNKDVPAKGRDTQPLQVALMPILESTARLAACADLNIGGQGASVVCSLDGPDAGDTILMFNPMMSKCGDGFCGHIVMPFKRDGG